MNPSDVQSAIAQVCDDVKSILLEKNRAYGNSALAPLRIFSRADPVEQLNVRIDDKLSRIARGREFGSDDTELDLIGYLVLRRVARVLATPVDLPLVRVGQGDGQRDIRT
ncbi:MAG: hypothetical protein NTX87_07715 [Planctomycetota bacterium]|nr:hypothetical protein [Planctomycetota bacterium]